MDIIKQIEKLEALCTKIQVRMEFTMRGGECVTIYPSQGKYEVRAVRGFFQQLNGEDVATLFVMDDRPLTQAALNIQTEALEAIRRYLLKYYGLKPDFLWTKT